MHASEAFVNGAGEQRRTDPREPENLDLLNTLLSSTAAVQPGRQSVDERQADEESKQAPATKPGRFENDPNDPSNPNEVRERHLKKVKTVSRP
jgi:hypothetical protein